jgi:hypothetical protein
MAEIKAAGKGDITHYPEIESEDLTKLYNNIYMDPSTPTGLANRVQMNARLYFCRRANENMESMTKDTFVIRIYSVTGRRYVMKKVDEFYRSFLEPTFIGNIKTVFRKLPKPVALRVMFLKVSTSRLQPMPPTQNSSSSTSLV